MVGVCIGTDCAYSWRRRFVLGFNEKKTTMGRKVKRGHKVCLVRKALVAIQAFPDHAVHKDHWGDLVHKDHAVHKEQWVHKEKCRILRSSVCKQQQ